MKGANSNLELLTILLLNVQLLGEGSPAKSPRDGGEVEVSLLNERRGSTQECKVVATNSWRVPNTVLS